jgi:hypothetical protein
MFGKHFASMYEGSMMGAGPTVFAVWGYVISKAVNGEVELNPRLITVLIGSTEEDVESAIDYLCSEDPRSRNKDENGRRLVKTGEYSYSVTSHALYRGIRHEDDRRDYNRRKQAEYREKKKPCTEVYHGVPPSAHTEAEAEAEAEAEKKKKGASTKRFIPPSVDDVKAYCEERGNKVDASSFIDHYAANGWMRGKSKIKDWKACVRTWETPKPNGTTATASIWPEIVAHLGRIDPYKDYSEGIAAKFGNKALAAVKSIGVPNINQANEYQASVLAKRFGELMQ